jgi:hypothetical protein
MSDLEQAAHDLDAFVASYRRYVVLTQSAARRSLPRSSLPPGCGGQSSRTR